MHNLSCPRNGNKTTISQLKWNKFLKIQIHVSCVVKRITLNNESDWRTTNPNHSPLVWCIVKYQHCQTKYANEPETILKHFKSCFSRFVSVLYAFER